MNKLLLISIILISGQAFSDESHSQSPSDSQTINQSNNATKQNSEHKDIGKLDYKTAKAQCQKENKGLKGKKLESCIKTKTM